MQWSTVNPANGKPIKNYESLDENALEKIIASAEKSYQTWKTTLVSDRVLALKALANNLRAELPNAALLMTREMGKPIAQSEAEIEKCAVACDYYATHLEEFLKDEFINAHYKTTFVAKVPLGLVLSIMPWNFPFWQVIRFAIPAIAAGNGVLLKHAPNVQGTAFLIEKLFRDSFPVKVLHNVCVDTGMVPQIIADPRIRGVSFTGSTQTGKKIATLCGQNLKKCVLELGGSDPYLILSDADISHAANECVKARFQNAGQSCIAGKRFIVQKPVFNEFLSAVIRETQKLVVGNPELKNTDLGPLCEKRFVDQLDVQLKNSLALGAQVQVVVGQKPSEGFYFLPTIVTQVLPPMPLFNEEVFGPVFPIATVETEWEAITLANQSSFGLGAAVFTKDLERGEKIAREFLESGMAVVNARVISDPRVPFGGIKDSGIGRELGRVGIQEFLNLKTIGIN